MPAARTDSSWSADLWWYLGLVAAYGIAFGVGRGPLAGLLAAGGMLAFTLLLALGRRRVDALRIAGGAGDERNRELYTRALATAGSTLALVVTGWYLFGVARGEPDGILFALALFFAIVFVAASVYESRRG